MEHGRLGTAAWPALSLKCFYRVKCHQRERIMPKEAEQGQATPAVVPGYGEADDEAASMDNAAQGGETQGQAGMADAGQPASGAAAKVVPDVAGPVGYGTTETDVKRVIAETASREAPKPADAG